MTQPILDRVRDRTTGWHQTVTETGWPARLMISIGLAGFLSLMAMVSFPVPWTPVPFSLTPFALLVVGAYQRPGWAGLSVILYLLAGAVGAPIYAEGSSGWEHLIGNTAGYLVGYVLVAAFVSWYVQERRRLLPGRWIVLGGAFLLVTVSAGITAIVRFNGSGAGFARYGESYQGWTYSASMLWVFAFLTVVAVAAVVWSFLRVRGQGRQALNLYLVFIAATGLLHLCGVLGLMAIVGLDPITAIIVGSVVFLPFDIIKAGLGVALTLPFLPDPVDSGPASPLPTLPGDRA